jgi:hypothetical protein
MLFQSRVSHEFMEIEGRNKVFVSARQKKNTLHHVPLVVNLYRFRIC